jgi:hypothetical protein
MKYLEAGGLTVKQMSCVVKVTPELIKIFLGDAEPLIIDGFMNFLAIIDIVDEYFD